MITTTAARYASWTCAEAGSARWMAGVCHRRRRGRSSHEWRAEPDPMANSDCPTDSGGPALWPCRARRIGAFPKPIKDIIRSNPESGSSITYLAALPVALSERRCLRVPTGSHITIAAHLASKDHRQPHLLSTRCRNAPSVPAPSAPQGQGSDRWSGATRDRLRIAATPRLLRSSLAIATSLPALGRVPRPWGV